jgi:drug/metabolite transporter (DMT)-like permease
MSIVAPIAATSAFVPVVVGVLTGDRPSGVQLAGMAAAIAGTVLASRIPTASDPDRAPVRRGIALALVASVLLGGALAALGHASDESPISAVVATRLASLTVVSLVVAATRPPVGQVRSALPSLVVLGFIDTCSTLMFALANDRGLLGVVGVIAALGPVFTIALARIFLAERLTRSQGLGVALAMGGVICLGAG